MCPMTFQLITLILSRTKKSPKAMVARVQGPEAVGCVLDSRFQCCTFKDILPVVSYQSTGLGYYEDVG